MEAKDLEKLCNFAVLKNHRRGEYALCNRGGDKKDKPVQCAGSQIYPTGHASDYFYIDAQEIKSCPHRS